jgi:lysyl endopeptidase
MKKHFYFNLIAVVLTLVCVNTYAQVKTKIFDGGVPSSLIPASEVPRSQRTVVAPVEFGNLRAQGDADKSTDFKNRFALPVDVDIDILTTANITERKDFIVYAFSLVAQNARNVSLKFSEFNLSAGAVLSIYTRHEMTDSITAKQNSQSRVWATRVYQGNNISIVLKVPREEKGVSILRISQLNFGYKKFGQEFGNIGSSENCNINVVCPQGNGWENERNSVAMIISGGNESCTGALVTNTCNTNIPYLLTANHCLNGDVQNWVFQFQTWSTTCNGNNGWREDVQFNGCQLRANSSASDFALVELNQIPPANSGITYAGWSRETAGITENTILHHPAGDLMKISKDNNAPTTTTIDGISCWQLGLDIGATQGGTSGAPYFNQAHRIIAQHYGTGQTNLPACQRIIKYGGRFDLSWTGGGTNATRLSNWLDPANTGALTTNTMNVSNLIPTQLVISGSNAFCNGTSQYTLNVPAGTNVSWQSSNSNIATVSSTGNPATVTRILDGTVTITATITVCGTPVSVTKEINIGIPFIDLVTFSNGANENQYFCTSHYGNQFLPYFSFTPENSSIEYRVLSWPSFNVVYTDPIAYPVGLPIPMNYMSTPGSYVVVEVKLTTPCGSTAWMGFEVEFVDCSEPGGCFDCPFRLTASPNPTDGDLNVTIEKEKQEVKALNKNEKVRYILYDGHRAQMVKQWMFDNGQNRRTLNVRGIRAGQYILVVTKGKYRQSTQIIIK